MHILREVNLKPYNSMALDAIAEYFCDVSSLEDVREAIEYSQQQQLKLTVFGGGSNIILPPRIAGLVIRITIKGLRKTALPNQQQSCLHLIEVGAGENWHKLVAHCLASESYGLENLALIPGSCGAAPIQNIGAYGVELKDVFHSLDAIDAATGEGVTLTHTDCQFAYRDSVFKNTLCNQLIITQLRLQLSSKPELHIEYPALKEALEVRGSVELTPQLVAETVCNIRRQKLPDPAQVPNVGSFFKNPIVDESIATKLRAEFPDLVCYSHTEGKVKLAAGWLIDQAGWKGFRRGSVGVHDQQALVLINTDGATGKDVLSLANEIVLSVKQRYDIELEMEPQKIGW